MDLYLKDYFKFIDVTFNKLLETNETLEGFYLKDKTPLKLNEIYN
jgi:hypothetical protein